MKLNIRGFITPKQSETFKDCADRYAFNQSNQRFALSDGVSQSFFPSYWAEILVDEWVQSKELEVLEIINSARASWESKVVETVNQEGIPWYTTNSYLEGKPGMATFVGLRFYRKGEHWSWKAYALGDSYLFFIPSIFEDYYQSLIKFSSNTNDEFDNYPDYIASKETFITKGEMKSMVSEACNGTFFLMSDALAEWFIKEGVNAPYLTETWENQNDFERFINGLREDNKIANDDSAILIIKIDDASESGFDLIGCEYVFDINAVLELDHSKKQNKSQGKQKENISLKSSCLNVVTDSKHLAQKENISSKDEVESNTDRTK